jgi:hypothetical protein
MSLRKEIWQFDKRELDERTRHVTIVFYHFAHWIFACIWAVNKLQQRMMNRKVRTLYIYLLSATGLSVYCRDLQVQGPHEMITVLREPDLMDETNGE